jgi:hypothetical protein
MVGLSEERQCRYEYQNGLSSTFDPLDTRLHITTTNLLSRSMIWQDRGFCIEKKALA